MPSTRYQRRVVLTPKTLPTRRTINNSNCTPTVIFSLTHALAISPPSLTIHSYAYTHLNLKPKVKQGTSPTNSLYIHVLTSKKQLNREIMHDNAIIAVLLATFTGIILLGIVYVMKRRARLRRELRVRHAKRDILNWNRANRAQNPEAAPAGSKKPAASKKGEPAPAKTAPKAPSVSKPKSVPFHLPSQAEQKPPSAHSKSKSKRGSQAGPKSSATVQDQWPAEKATAADANSQPGNNGSWKPVDAFANGGNASQKVENEWDQNPVENKSTTSQKAEEPKEEGNQVATPIPDDQINW